MLPKSINLTLDSKIVFPELQPKQRRLLAFLGIISAEIEFNVESCCSSLIKPFALIFIELELMFRHFETTETKNYGAIFHLLKWQDWISIFKQSRTNFELCYAKLVKTFFMFRKQRKISFFLSTNQNYTALTQKGSFFGPQG